MAVLAQSRSRHFSGLRPMDPLRDLSRVADLIEEAFASELDRSGQSALRELRWLSRLKPVLWWMVTFNNEYSDFLSGFVWEEDAKIVGNITVNQTSPGSRRWLISNVAVSEAYRGRGIARGLMDAALELVKECNGRSVSLQVRADNAPARHIYQTLHFKEISGITHLHFRRVPRVNVPPLPAGVTIRPRRYDAADARLAYQLAGAATPPSAQKEWPLRRSRFQLGMNERLQSILQQLIGGGPLVYWMVEAGQQVVSTVNIIPGVLGQNHRLEITVHPDWRGQLEKPLICRALNFLYRWRSNRIQIKQPVDHVEAIETFMELGGRLDQTLIWMKREM